MRSTMDYIFPIFLCFIFLNNIHGGVLDNKVEECDISDALIQEIRGYKPVVEQIINATVSGKYRGGTYKELETFVDRFGARLYGTKNLEESIDYMLDLLNNTYNLDNVHGEEVPIPRWERGTEEGELIAPRTSKLAVLALGTSVGTGPEGLEAEVLVVRSFDELNLPNNSAAAANKIVVFNEEYTTYGGSVQYRGHGAVEAAKLGAVAVLIRSVTPFSMYNLHTGSQSYEEDVTKIPAACITPEDAHMLQRLQDKGEKIIIRLNISTTNYPMTTSRNTVAEIEGSSIKERVVLVSGHLDSWDVGVGAMDDGGGAFISWYALAVLRGLGLRAKRTLRAVLWTAEEPGLYGVVGYNETHKNEIDNFTFVMESDEGTFTPLGIEYNTGPKGGCIIQEILKLLEPINATQAKSSNDVGSDITIWANRLPTASLLNENERYFWYHHSAADTMDVLDPDNLDKATVVWATVAYIIADLSEEFPRDFESPLNSLKQEQLNRLRKRVLGKQ